MADKTTSPIRLPEPGFYYHYKHDSNKSEFDYAEEVLGTARHTEDNSYGVIYRPLYETDYLTADFFVRPLDMFMGTVSKDGEEVARFTRITDAALVERLKTQRDRMYL